MDFGIYFYGVTLDEDWKKHNIPGIDANACIDKITVDDLNAVFSLVPLEEFGSPAIDQNIENLEWLKTKAEIHMKVLNEIMSLKQLIPMKFCTIFYDDEKIKNLLRTNYEDLKNALSYLSEKQEWSCKAYYDKKQFVNQYTANAKKTINDTKMSKGASYFKKKKLDSEMEEKAEREIFQIAEELFNEIKELGIDFKRNKNVAKEITQKKEDMILNISLLLDDEHSTKLIEEIEMKNQKLKDQFIYIECTGPWPPYDFSPSFKMADL
ncbi:MAG: GvpL/GvpF family gas vesicle protein [Bacillota bacterium]